MKYSLTLITCALLLSGCSVLPNRTANDLPAPTPEVALQSAFTDAYPDQTVTISLDQLTDTHARGQVLIGEVIAGNGGLFLAMVKEEQWHIVHEGNGTLPCDELLAANFPENMITECATANEPTNMVAANIYIDDVRLAILESFPVQVRATVYGQYADGCTSMKNMTVSENDNTFTIILEGQRPKDALCSQALVPFEKNVSLDVLGKPAGEYTVVAGDTSTTFTLDGDNILPIE